MEYRARLFISSDAQEVSDLICRTLREVNIRDYPADEIEKMAGDMTPESIEGRAAWMHFYVFLNEQKIVGCGAIGPYWGKTDESSLFTIFVLPEHQGRGVGRLIMQTLERDEYFRRAKRVEIPASITACGFYRKFGYDYKNGVTEPDEERLIRLEKRRKDMGKGDKPMKNLQVAADRRHLIYEDGTPFFYLADTAWELFHKLNREEAFMYLENRAEKGFTVVQAVALAEKDGLRRSNAYGRCPMKIDENGVYDPEQMDTDGEYSYWDHVDAIVEKAKELGIYIAMLPTWGDKFVGMRGEGPHIFTKDKAYAYGQWLGRRYKDAGNIIWVMGGDRVFSTRAQLEALDAMARGIKAGDGGRYLMTMHPAGGQHSADCAHDEEWMDFNMIQSGHTRSRYNYQMIKKDYKRLPYKPVLDGEPNYEGHPESFNISNGYMDDTDARQSAYWSVLSGACGHTYGHHSIWNFVTLPDKDTKKGHFAMNWQSALNQPGSGQMKHLRALVESVAFGEGAPAAGMVSGNMEAVNFVPVLKGEKWLIAYSAQGLMFDLELGEEWTGAAARWFNPRTGEWSEAFGAVGGRIESFVPPSAGRGSDWALLLKRE